MIIKIVLLTAERRSALTKNLSPLGLLPLPRPPSAQAISSIDHAASRSAAQPLRTVLALYHCPHTHLFLGARASACPLQGPECLPVGRNQMLYQYVSNPRYSSRSSPVPPSISRRNFNPTLLIRVAILVLYSQPLINAYVRA